MGFSNRLRLGDGTTTCWARPGAREDNLMSGFLDKAKEAAEGLKDKAEALVDKVEEAIPDSVKEKAGDLKEKAGEMASKVKDKVEDIIPGDKDGDGH